MPPGDEPRQGWTLPAGFMENGEEPTLAPTGKLGGSGSPRHAGRALYGLWLPHINQLYLFFRGTLDHVAFAPGRESLEVALAPETIPEGLAFRAVEKTLRYWPGPGRRPPSHAPRNPRARSSLRAAQRLA